MNPPFHRLTFFGIVMSDAIRLGVGFGNAHEERSANPRRTRNLSDKAFVFMSRKKGLGGREIVVGGRVNLAHEAAVGLPS